MSRRTKRRDQRAQDFKDQRVKGVKNFDFGQHDPKNAEGGHVSGQEARFVAGKGKQKNAYAALLAQKQAGATFGKRAQSKMDRMGARIDKRAEAKGRAQEVLDTSDVQPYEPPGQSSNPEYNPSSNPSNQQTAVNTGDIDQTTEITNTQEQNINQDNDQNVTVNGNNNTTISTQDNSIRQYGGDNRSLVINEANTGNQNGGGGSGGYYNTADKAITMGTLGGFYDVDDSAGAQAAFVDLNQDLNAQAQKRYAGQGLATAAGYTNYRAGDVDIYGLQSRIDNTPNMFFDMAAVQGVRTYGDRDVQQEPIKYEFGAEIKPIESRADEIAEGYKDDIEDL